MKRRVNILLTAVAIIVAAAFTQPSIPQDPGYHDMADERTHAGIPNALNVLSNVPFAIVGLWGFAEVFRSGGSRMRFHDPWLRWPYAVLFAGVAATSIGSSFYHLAPDNARLVWDRLPMTVGFMGLLAALIGERVNLRVARALLVPLLVLGVFSVFYWDWTERAGRGDLRLYGVVQFGSLAIVLLTLMLFHPLALSERSVGRVEGRDTFWLSTGLALYGLAKVFEFADAGFLSLTGFVSGHTLKHLSAAAGVALIVVMLHARDASNSEEVLVRRSA